MALMQQMMAGGPEQDEEMMESPEMEATENEEMEGGEPSSVPREVAAEILRALQKPGVKKAVIKASESEDPANALSGLAYGMIEGLDEKSGGSIPAEQMPSIAMELVEMLASLAAAATGDKVDDQLQGQILGLLLDRSMKTAEKKLSGRGGGEQQMPGGGQPQMPQPMGVQ